MNNLISALFTLFFHIVVLITRLLTNKLTTKQKFKVVLFLTKYFPYKINFICFLCEDLLAYELKGIILNAIRPHAFLWSHYPEKKPNQKFRLDKEYAEWRYNWLLSLYKSYYK